jgi:putative ABC transport system permease protein
MLDLVSGATEGTRFLLVLVGLFAALAVLLACLGVYGVLSNAVSERTREIGVRIALGARRDEVFRMVLGQGLAPAAVGTVVGVAGTLLLGRLMHGLLFGVAPHDPTTVAAVVALLVAVAILACTLPARRATRVDPIEAIRAE